MKPITSRKMLINSIGYHVIKHNPCDNNSIFNALWAYMGGSLPPLSDYVIDGALEPQEKFEKRDGKWAYLG